MARVVKPLTFTQIKAAKPKEKAYKLFDGGGLYLEIQASGQKFWRLKYTQSGKESRISFGKFPEVSLEKAREKRDEARRLMSDGVSLSANQRALKTARNGANSFEVIAREWHGKQAAAWTPDYADQVLYVLTRYVFSEVGDRLVNGISSADMLAVIRQIEARGKFETARRILGYCGSVFRYAVVTGRADNDPTSALKGALQRAKKKHFSAITDPKKVAGLIRAIDGYEGTFSVECALRLAPILFVRPGELRKAEWTDIDLEKSEWRYLVTKTDTAHIVPLSAQAVEILKRLYRITGKGKYVFPSPRTDERPMSDNAVLSALRRMGISKEEMTGHGFRAMARTILDEVLGYRPDRIEHQLAHSVKDPNGRAYNRTMHLEERRKMMQHWADYLDELKK